MLSCSTYCPPQRTVLVRICVITANLEKCPHKVPFLYYFRSFFAAELIEEWTYMKSVS